MCMFFPEWVIWMAIIRNGWVQWLRIIIVFQPLTSRLCLVAISWYRPDPCTRWNSLDLLMTDLPDLVWNSVVEPICNSDLCSLPEVVAMVHSVPNLCVSKKIFLTHKINCITVSGATQNLPCGNIWSGTSIFPCWLYIYITKDKCAHKKLSRGLMILNLL